jgi:hypothetical protein
MDTNLAPSNNPISGLDEKTAFFALANEGRREVLRRMAMAGTAQTARQLCTGNKKTRNLTVKQLTLLTELGVVRSIENPADGRANLYVLSPLLTTRRTPVMWELDFGCTVLRWRP